MIPYSLKRKRKQALLISQKGCRSLVFGNVLATVEKRMVTSLKKGDSSDTVRSVAAVVKSEYVLASDVMNLTVVRLPQQVV